MIKRKKGICQECSDQKEKLLVKNKPPTCIYHYQKENAKRYQQNRKPIARKKTGELELFEEIWNERAHESEVSGEKLLSFDVSNFSHLLPKGLYPKFRLKKENIVLKTRQEHYDWEYNQHKLVDKQEWKWVFEKKEQLKLEYNQK